MYCFSTFFELLKVKSYTLFEIFKIRNNFKVLLELAVNLWKKVDLN